jgi:PAS domain S-box-containing protein
MEDVTERKQAEQERKQAEMELLREKQFAEKLLESLPGIFFLYDSTCHLKRWNKAHETAMGFTADELRDWYIPDWHETPEDAAVGMALVKSVLETGVGGAFETTLINKEGRFVPYLISITRLMTPDGPVMMGVGIDITERKRAEEEREKTERSYQLLVKNIPAVVYKGYVDGAVEFFDNKIQAVIGYSMEDFASGKLKWTELIHPEDAAAAKRSLLQALRGEREYVREYRVKRLDGQYAWVQERSQIVCHEDGRIDYISGVLFDVRERKRSEEEKEKLEAQFSQAQKMEAIGRLAGGVAHDFNNMLSVILGYSELALRKLQPIDPIYKELKAVQEAANRSADLTRQLLAFSRKQTISPRVVDLNEQTRAMERLLTRIIGEDINLTLNLLPGLWPVYMDPAQLDQIVANLAVNSRDAMPEGGKLMVETANTIVDADFCKSHGGLTPGDFVMLAVTDTGCGVDRETLDHVFEPFFTTKPEGKGTGLGLATVYGIAKQNNGFVYIYSELGRGTTVKVYLPRYVGHEAAVPAPPKEGSPAGGWETILLVEDESQIRQLAKTILETLGYRVLEASSPGEAIVLCEKHPRSIHLLLTDMVMPNMNGKELEGKIRAMMPRVRTLFMSGYTGDVIAQHGVFDETVHFLPKPFSVRSLAEKVRQVLDG